MLVEALLSALFGLLDSIFGLIPSVDLSFSSTLQSFATAIGSQVGSLDSFLPISEALPILGWTLTVYLPFLVVFYTVRYIYSMIPVVGQGS